MLLNCEVVIWMLFTDCNFQFSVFSIFIVFSACSNLSTNFWKSISGSRNEDGCDASFFIVFFVIVMLKS